MATVTLVVAVDLDDSAVTDAIERAISDGTVVLDLGSAALESVEEVTL